MSTVKDLHALKAGIGDIPSDRHRLLGYECPHADETGVSEEWDAFDIVPVVQVDPHKRNGFELDIRKLRGQDTLIENVYVDKSAREYRKMNFRDRAFAIVDQLHKQLAADPPAMRVQEEQGMTIEPTVSVRDPLPQESTAPVRVVPTTVPAASPLPAPTNPMWPQPMQAPAPFGEAVPGDPYTPAARQAASMPMPSAGMMVQPSMLRGRIRVAEAQQASDVTAMPMDLTPLKRVSLEIYGIPFTLTVHFHEIVRELNTLMLVFDNRAQGHTRFEFPPEALHQRVAVALDDMPNVIFETVWTGFCVPFKHWTLMILQIVQEYPTAED